ncbi:hypothetical protein A2Z33_03650 [Candidatus Gottesmanbacteria bacterium RBG_16_52_11]|uniref:Uncharacterized protein n=1 Tax=Candidatus Gottesmanbacteria bacterium RBG_16_52_11 TaxID=1798374 RepID=A0A1F5YVH6_9BACT|nr:MAG: hypothetical protein A2Z33_03650 [Candidatus Gottesmanbacteria bacterium RBG_16_52_11]
MLRGRRDFSWNGGTRTAIGLTFTLSVCYFPIQHMNLPATVQVVYTFDDGMYRVNFGLTDPEGNLHKLYPGYRR